MHRKLFVLALLACVACFGGDDAVAPEPSTDTSETELPSSPIVDQRVTVAYGAKVVQLPLIERCIERQCSRTPGDAPSLKVAEKLPVMTMTFEIAPDALEVSLKTKGRRGEPKTLAPGELVAWRPSVPPGRHDARVTATYGNVRLEWRIFLRR